MKIDLGDGRRVWRFFPEEGYTSANIDDEFHIAYEYGRREIPVTDDRGAV